jgi:hypothetical protein
MARRSDAGHRASLGLSQNLQFLKSNALTLQRGGTSAARLAEISHVVEGRALLARCRLSHIRQHRDQTQSGFFVSVDECAGYLMVWEAVHRSYLLIFFSPLEI